MSWLVENHVSRFHERFETMGMNEQNQLASIVAQVLDLAAGLWRALPAAGDTAQRQAVDAALTQTIQGATKVRAALDAFSSTEATVEPMAGTTHRDFGAELLALAEGMSQVAVSAKKIQQTKGDVSVAVRDLAVAVTELMEAPFARFKTAFASV
jgi:hypothetical protein